MHTSDDEIEEEPPQVRRLRILVMVLLVVLILGFLTIVLTIVIRLGFGGGGNGVTPVTAGEVVLPEGEVLSIGQGDGTLLFLVRAQAGERLFVVDARTGKVVSETPMVRE